jgi:hypothetical protein
VTTWTPEEPGRVGQAEELQLATRRCQGGLSRYVTMWGWCGSATASTSALLMAASTDFPHEHV